MNREEWLTLVSTRHIRPLFDGKGGNIKYKYRVSVGFPKGSRGGKTAESIGQCWPAERSADKVCEMFIHPMLGAFDAISVLIHEHVHASVGLQHKHGKPFKQLAKAVGLVGKMTATTAGEELALAIKIWLSRLPEYPHGVLDTEVAAKEPKPGSRLIKCACPECGYTVRTTQKWLDIGPPHCPEHDAMSVEGQNEEEGDE